MLGDDITSMGETLGRKRIGQCLLMAALLPGTNGKFLCWKTYDLSGIADVTSLLALGSTNLETGRTEHCSAW